MANPPGTIEPGQMASQIGRMNESEPEKFYLPEDDKKRHGKGSNSDTMVSDKPGSSFYLNPSAPRLGINPELQQQMEKLDFQKQDAGDSFVQINRDHDMAAFNKFNFKGFAEPGDAMTSDIRTGYGKTPNEVAPDGKDAPQRASRRNPVWGDVVTDRYGMTDDDANLGAKSELEANAGKGKPNGDVVMKDINPKVVQPLTSGSFDAARGARGPRSSLADSFKVNAATLGNTHPSALLDHPAVRNTTPIGEGNDSRNPTSYEELKLHTLPNGAIKQDLKKVQPSSKVLNAKDGKTDMDRMYTTPDTNPLSPATDMMANIGQIEFGGKEDKDGLI